MDGIRREMEREEAKRRGDEGDEDDEERCAHTNMKVPPPHSVCVPLTRSCLCLRSAQRRAACAAAALAAALGGQGGDAVWARHEAAWAAFDAAPPAVLTVRLP